MIYININIQIVVAFSSESIHNSGINFSLLQVTLNCTLQFIPKISLEAF